MKNIGGKLSLFTTLLPQASSSNQELGPGRLVNRMDSKLLGTDKEVNLLKSQEGFYKNFALDCSRQQISVDCFLFNTQQYIDVATLGPIESFPLVMEAQPNGTKLEFVLQELCLNSLAANSFSILNGMP